MMTFAMPVVLDGPVPRKPPHSLLAVPGVLIDEASERWMSGATVYGYPEETPDVWDPCSTGTFRTKGTVSTQPLPMFASFTVVQPITCSSLSIGDPDEFRDRARATLEATESWAVEQALSQGTAVATNPFFDDGNVAILAGGAAVAPQVALSYLEDAIGVTGRTGMIHATPGVASQWFDQMGELTSLVTNLGTPVAVGGGYAGSQPTGGAAAAAGQAWAYATGPVQVRHSETEVLDIKEVLDRSDNTVTFRAERQVLATWDTALQAAVLVDWSP